MSLLLYGFGPNVGQGVKLIKKRCEGHRMVKREEELLLPWLEDVGLFRRI